MKVEGCTKANMSDWKMAKTKKASQTPGHMKGISCQADALKKFFAKRSRSYKHQGYSSWCKKMDNLNK